MEHFPFVRSTSTVSQIVSASFKNTIKGAGMVILGILAGAILSFAARVLIARNTTQEEFGIYTLTIAFATVYSLLASAGIHEGTPRYISLFLGEGREADSRLLSRACTGIGMILSLSAFALLFLLADSIAEHIFYKPQLAAPLRAISFYVPFLVMSQNMSAIMRGYNIIVPKVLFLDIGMPLYALLFLLVYASLGLPFIWIIWAYPFAITLTFIMMARYGYKETDLALLSPGGRRYQNELLRFSFPLLVGSLSVMLLGWTGALMLGRYADATAVGLYHVTTILATLLTLPLAALEFVFMPVAGEFYGGRRHYELKRIYQLVTKWAFLVTFPLFFLLFLFPEPIIVILFGDNFLASSLPLRILAMGFLFHALLGPNGILMVTIGTAREVMNVSLAGAAFNIGLNYALVKHLGYGIVGASAATAVTYVALNLAVFWIVYKKTGIHPFTRKLMTSIACSLIILVGFLLLRTVHPISLWMAALYFVLFLCAYVLCLVLTGTFDIEDMALFHDMAQKTGLEFSLIRKIAHRFHIF